MTLEILGKEVARLERLHRAERFDLWARRLVLVVFLLLAFAASLGAQEPQAVLYVGQFVPTPEMAAMYHEVEDCLHEKGDFGRVYWYSVAAPWTSKAGTTWGLRRDGNFGHSSIIAVKADTAILRHEMVHDVMRRNGFEPVRSAADSNSNAPEHPTPPFGTCARRFFGKDYKPWGRQ